MKRAMKTFFLDFKEVFAIAPGYVVIATFTQVFDQLLSVVNIYVIQFVLNSIATSNSIYTNYPKSYSYREWRMYLLKS